MFEGYGLYKTMVGGDDVTAADQLIDDLKAIAIDLAAVDRMTVELAVQEIINLRAQVAEYKNVLSRE